MKFGYKEAAALGLLAAVTGCDLDGPKVTQFNALKTEHTAACWSQIVDAVPGIADEVGSLPSEEQGAARQRTVEANGQIPAFQKSLTMSEVENICQRAGNLSMDEYRKRLHDASEVLGTNVGCNWQHGNKPMIGDEDGRAGGGTAAYGNDSDQTSGGGGGAAAYYGSRLMYAPPAHR